MIKRAGQALIVALIAAGATTLHAQQTEVATAQLQVLASVSSNCRLNVLPLDFGSYDPLDRNSSEPLRAETDLSLLCTRNTPATVSLDFGVNASSIDGRSLALGPDRLRYQLFRDSSRTQIWGSGADAFSIGAAPGIREPLTLPVYGAIPPAQEVISGSYSDTITARVDF